MSDVDRIADALFERIRRLAVSALTQPLGAGGLVVAEIANTESGATLNKWIDVYESLLRRNDGQRIELSSLSTRFNEIIRAVHGDGVYAEREWPSLHEVRSLSERLYRSQGIQTQHLLGHKNQEMTDKYNDERGLTAAEWKHLAIPGPGRL